MSECTKFPLDEEECRECKNFPCHISEAHHIAENLCQTIKKSRVSFKEFAEALYRALRGR